MRFIPELTQVSEIIKVKILKPEVQTENSLTISKKEDHSKKLPILGTAIDGYRKIITFIYITQNINEIISINVLYRLHMGGYILDIFY